MSYKLYFSPGSCAMATHIILEEIGEPFTTELILSLGDREGAGTSTEEWRRVNPKGRIPVLEPVAGSMGGRPGALTEVPAISYYLASRHPSAGLIPTSVDAAARCFEWMNWLSSNVHAMSYGQIWRPQRFSDDEQTFAAIREKGRRSVVEQYGYIESILSDGRTWAVGDVYSIADPYLLVFFRWGGRVGINMRADYPAWSVHADRMLERPAVERVLAKEGVTIDFPNVAAAPEQASGPAA